MPVIRLSLLTVVTLALLAGCQTVAPPIQEMTDARLAIAAASDAGADKYATDVLTEARLLLKSAENNLERNAYGAARRDANLAKQMATEARERAEGKSGKPDRMPGQPLK